MTFLSDIFILELLQSITQYSVERITLRRILRNEKTAVSAAIGVTLMVALACSAAAALSSWTTYENNKLIEQVEMTERQLHVIKDGNGNLNVLPSDSEVPPDGKIILKINGEEVSVPASAIDPGSKIDIGSLVEENEISANEEGDYLVDLIIINSRCARKDRHPIR